MKKIILFWIFWTLVASPANAYERIISFRPNVTEILFALGLGDRVVGVTDFCKYPPEAQKIEKIGGYFNRSLEKILDLKPDLVVLVPDATTAKIESALRRAGIEILTLRADSIEDVSQSIRAIAQKTEIPEKGEALVREIQGRMAEEAKKIASLPRRRTLLVIQRRPLITAGGGTFLDSLVTLAGGDNISGSSKLPYPQFSMESVLARAPEVIIDFDTSDPGDFWTRYPSLPAVKNGAVKHLSPELFVPGPRLPQALTLLIEAMHS